MVNQGKQDQSCGWGLFQTTHVPGYLLQWKALPGEELGYNLLEVLWFYLALVLASFFMVSLLSGPIILIPFVDGVMPQQPRGVLLAGFLSHFKHTLSRPNE